MSAPPFELLPSSTEPCVAELQGLEGAFVFSELVLQKVWFRGDFLSASARTLDGRRLRILSPGRWNRQGGPDFREARLELEGRELLGDVEVHVHAGDWEAHRHALDPEYRRVVLHVVLFPPREDHVTHGFDGRQIPIFPLLTLLTQDLEALALDDAAERLSGRPSSFLVELLAQSGVGGLLETLRLHALRRWNDKTAFAHLRLDRLGWNEACHHGALECLGYSGNRAAMLEVAGRWPLDLWSRGAVDVSSVYEMERSRWRLRSGRPCNHPLTRLRQYEEWTRAVPDWAVRLKDIMFPLLTPREEQKRRHRGLGLAPLRRNLSEHLCHSRLGGTRFDSFVCDVCLPLHSALKGEALFELWFQWYLGDLPDTLRTTLREAAHLEPCLCPSCNGFAQGLIACLAGQGAESAGAV